LTIQVAKNVMYGISIINWWY